MFRANIFNYASILRCLQIAVVSGPYLCSGPQSVNYQIWPKFSEFKVNKARLPETVISIYAQRLLTFFSRLPGKKFDLALTWATRCERTTLKKDEKHHQRNVFCLIKMARSDLFDNGAIGARFALSMSQILTATLQI